MEKQMTESCTERGMRVIPYILYGCGVLVLCLMIAGLIFWRNPFMVQKVDASDEAASIRRTQIGDYVQVEHMDLRFTGFYTVNGKQEICGYYYIGRIGEMSWFVEIPARKGDTGLSQTMTDLEDTKFTAQIAEDLSVVDNAADREGITKESYIEKYSLSDKVLMTYATDRERDILYYAIALCAAVGCFVSGRLLTRKC
nr:hypothetical protein [Frisingicoccus sp.]